ncbi:MAG: DMT family transporter [Phycisphaerae bacterium]|nr:DMT family transporter [Phycisphaerae bacterium]
MSNDHIGQLNALAAAMTWAVAMVFFKKTEGRVHPLAMNLFKNVLGVILVGLSLPLLGESWTDLANHPREEIFILIVSGFLGIALADTVFFYSLNLIGVSLFAIVDCTYSPIVLLVSWLMIGESLALPHYVGGLLIVSAVFISTRHPPPMGRTPRQIVIGVVSGVGAIALMAVGIVVAKPVLTAAGFPLLWAVAIRMSAGAGCLALMILASPDRRRLLGVFRPTDVWKYLVPGSFLGAYLSMVFWVAGFKYTGAAVAAVLNQTSMVFAIILAAIFLNERMTKRKLASVVLAAIGVLIITFAPVAG